MRRPARVIGKNGRAGRLFPWGEQFGRDLIIRVVQEHLDILLAIGGSGAGKSAFGDPLGESVANLAAIRDFVSCYGPYEYRLLSSTGGAHCFMLLKTSVARQAGQSTMD